MGLRIAAALALVLAAGGTAAQAGVYTDDLSKCLVKATAPADQQTLVLWIYAAMSSHPQVKPYSKLTESEQERATKGATELMQRLLTIDCRKEAVEAIQYEGAATMEAAFEVLGEVAMRNLMGDAAVAKMMEGMTKYLDRPALEALGREAGVRRAPAAK